MTGKSFKERFLTVQTELNAKKSKRNNFAKFNYRSVEDIIEAVKPLLKDNAMTLKLSDDVKMVGDRIYVVATATVSDCNSGEQESATAFAREDAQRPGMCEAQCTGSSSSYARKYALCGLLAIDDGENSDPDNYDNNFTNAKKEQLDKVSQNIDKWKDKAKAKAPANPLLTDKQIIWLRTAYIKEGVTSAGADQKISALKTKEDIEREVERLKQSLATNQDQLPNDDEVA